MQTNLINAISALLDAMDDALPTSEKFSRVQFLAQQWITCKGRMCDGYLPLSLIVKGRSARPVIEQAYLSLTAY